MLVGIFIIFLFIFLVVTVGASKAFIAFFALCILGCQYRISGPFTIEDALILLFVFLSINDAHFGRKARNYPVLFGICTLMYSLSVILSSVFTKSIPHYGIAFFSCLRITMLPFLFFYYVRSNQDIRYVVKFLVAITVFGFILSVISIVLQENVYLSMIRTLFGEEIGWDRIEEKRFGFSRVQAFCLQPVSYGYICTTLLSVFLLLLYKSKSSLCISNASMMIVVLTSIFGCLLCGSRSGIVPLFICLLYFFFKRSVKDANVSILVLAIIIVYFIYGNYFDMIWQSIFNSNENAIGSTSEMRLNQLDISLYYFMKSPIIGMGTYAIHDFVGEQMGEAILGGESIWFSLLINQGLFGCVAYVFLYLCAFSHIKDMKYDAFVFLILQLLINTLTSIPGYDSSIFLCLVLLVGKVNSHYSHLYGRLIPSNTK